MVHSAYTPEWLKSFKRKVNFFELLSDQAETTLGGLRGLHEWLQRSDESDCVVVHDLEHKADRQKMEIEESLRDTFVTPFNREDIYDISAQMDLIINGAKRVAKDLEFLKGRSTDPYLLRMSESIVNGCEQLLIAVRSLEDNLNEATSAANKARKTETQVQQIYRESFKALFSENNSETRERNKHLYDCMCVIAERVERLGERLLHISIKLG